MSELERICYPLKGFFSFFFASLTLEKQCTIFGCILLHLELLDKKAASSIKSYAMQIGSPYNNYSQRNSSSSRVFHILAKVFALWCIKDKHIQYRATSKINIILCLFFSATMQCRIELKLEKSNVKINSVSVSMTSPKLTAKQKNPQLPYQIRPELTLKPGRFNIV